MSPPSSAPAPPSSATKKRLANQAIEEVLEAENTDELEVPRAPVVTVMGHVDHGKTSLLDAIRETDVAAGEAGGITQHIGAYKVKFTKEGSPASGREIVFLDTPGHEAFTRMRARGAKVTDIVVIVVAADDGVMPQTLEAIDHAKAADVPIIVAVNKIDKPEANPDRVKKQLADRGLIPEEWAGGGEEGTVFVEVSAKKRINLDLLLEMICLVSDINAPKATPGRKAVGSVLEAKLDRGRGAVATVLVQDGTLHLNDSYIVGNTFGKVRAMFDDRGRALEEAGPSTPVEVLGLESMPDSGDTFLVVADRDKAKGIAQYRKMKEREAQLAKSSRVSLEGLSEQIRTAGVKDLPLIIKGDVTGSVEVLADSLVRMSTEKVRIKVIHSGVGSITESDVLLATASNAIIIGFNVRPERKAAELAQQEGVDIRLHSIIYELQDEMRLAMMGLLEPTFKENYLGRAEVLNIFRIPKVGTIAGCRVQDGVIRRDAEIKVMRGRRAGLQGQDRLAQALQRRCPRSHQRHGVRHRHRQLQRPEGRRPDRSFLHREDSPPTWASSPPPKHKPTSVILYRPAPHPRSGPILSVPTKIESVSNPHLAGGKRPFLRLKRPLSSAPIMLSFGIPGWDGSQIPPLDNKYKGEVHGHTRRSSRSVRRRRRRQEARPECRHSHRRCRRHRRL